MSEANEQRTTNSSMYVVWMVLFVLGFSCLQMLAQFGIHLAVYGFPTVAEALTIKTPDYSHTGFWKGRVVFPMMVVQMGNISNLGNISNNVRVMSFDPKKGDVIETKTSVSLPMVGFQAQGDRLWSVSNSTVVLTEGDESTEFPTRTLKRPSEPFLYEGELAVIEMGTRSQPTLFVFRDKDWSEVSPVEIPFAFQKGSVDGKSMLVPSPASSVGRIPLLDVQVISHNGEYHVFLSSGGTKAYRRGLELATPSALAPANTPETVDLADLSKWELACDVPNYSGLPGRRLWKGGLVDGEPVIVTVSAGSGNKNPLQNPFQSVSVLGFRRVDGEWGTPVEFSSPVIIDLVVVTDGESTYFAGSSLAGPVLRLRRFAGSTIEETGAIIEQPDPGFQSTLKAWVQLGQWVYWPGLLLFALGVNHLMRVYRSPVYQFGATTVELASFLRRAIARTIDYLIYVLGSYLVMWTVGLGMSEEEVQKNMDKIFDIGPDGLLIRWLWLMLALALMNLFLLGVNSWLQGRWGITLGKWIAGIRTVRSTLRPCGFFRAALRELLLLVDTVMTTTYIPATLMIALTNCRQRIGDLVADTVVIRKPKQQT